MIDSIVLAHQGGWDEILFVAVPALIAIYALRWADRKARSRSSEDKPHDDDEGEPLS